MTNTISAIIISTIVTNWVPCGDIVIEKRSVVVESETLALKDRVLDQPNLRTPDFKTNWMFTTIPTNIYWPTSYWTIPLR